MCVCPFLVCQTVSYWEQRLTCSRWKTLCLAWRQSWRHGFKSREEKGSTSTCCCQAPETIPFQVEVTYTIISLTNHPALSAVITHVTLIQMACWCWSWFSVSFMIFISCTPVVCVKCDMQERLISPALIPLSPNLGVKTESIRDFLPVAKGTTNQIQPPQRLKAIK